MKLCDYPFMSCCLAGRCKQGEFKSFEIDRLWTTNAQTDVFAGRFKTLTNELGIWISQRDALPAEDIFVIHSKMERVHSS